MRTVGKKSTKLARTIATRSVIAALPVALVSAYASNMLVPTPPRMASYDWAQVAEINVSPSTVGVAVSPLYGQTREDIEAQLSEMQAIGVENIRVFVPWALVEYNPVPGGTEADPNEYVWQYLDMVMEVAAEKDMGVLAEINSTPYHATASGTPSYTGTATPDPEKFADFMSDFIDRYGDIVSAYEVWNEPNAVLFSNPIDPEAYADLLKAASAVIKAQDPTATVVAGAVGHVYTFGNLTMDPVEFLQAMIDYDPDVLSYFDAFSYHPYDNTRPFSEGDLDPSVVGSWASDTAYNQLKDLISLLDGKKVWVSEFGVPTYTWTDSQGVTHTITEEQQNALIQNLISTLSDPDSEFADVLGPIFLYTGRDIETGTSDPHDNYGLWDDEGNPKDIVAWLTQYFQDHPQNPDDPTDPTDPTDPGNPADPLAAFFQALAQQLATAISQIISQNVVTALVNAITTAVQNFFSALGGQVQSTASTQSLLAASVDQQDPASITSELAAASRLASAKGEMGEESEDATESTLQTAESAPEETVDAAEAAPVVEAEPEPALEAEPEAEPVAEQPTEPAAEQPAEPAAEQPAEPAAEAGAVTTGADESQSDDPKADATGDDSKSAAKSDDAKGDDAKGDDSKGDEGKGDEGKGDDSKPAAKKAEQRRTGTGGPAAGGGNQSPHVKKWGHRGAAAKADGGKPVTANAQAGASDSAGSGSDE